MSKVFEDLLATIDSVRVTPYEVLDASNISEAMQEFLSATERRPLDPATYRGVSSDLLALRYPHFRYDAPKNLSLDIINEHMMTLLEVLTTLANGPIIEDIEEKLLTYMVVDSLWEHTMLHDVLDFRAGNDSPSNRENIQKCNEHLYGRPDPEICKSLIAEIFREINPGKLPPSHRNYYEDLQKQLTPIFPEGIIAQPLVEHRPDPKILQKFSERVNLFFAPLLVLIPKHEGIYPAKEVCKIINDIIDREFGIKTKFRAVEKDDIDNLQVSQANHEIWVPTHRARGDYDYDTLCRFVIRHEIFAHVYRAACLEGKCAPLSRGLTDYEEFEEGLANLMEASYDGKFNDHNPVMYYITAGLAVCFELDFRQVYDIVFALEYLTTVETDLMKRQKVCFNYVRRAFRGTGNVPFLKDLRYYNGIAKAYRYIAEHINDADLMDNLFMSGKIDSSNPVHQRFSKKFA